MAQKTCSNCADYRSDGRSDIYCNETGAPVGFFWVRSCWKEKHEQAHDNDMQEKKEQAGVPANRRGGRRQKFPNKVDPETGGVLKHCGICGEYKPIDDFPSNRSHKDGHGSECRICHNKATVEAGRRRRAKEREARAAEAAADFAPVPPVHPVEPANGCVRKDLASFSDQQLAAELKARGWDGFLVKSMKLDQI